MDFFHSSDKVIAFLLIELDTAAISDYIQVRGLK